MTNLEKEAQRLIKEAAESRSKKMLEHKPVCDPSNPNVTYFDWLLLMGHDERVKVLGAEKAKIFNEKFKDKIEQYSDFMKNPF